MKFNFGRNIAIPCGIVASLVASFCTAQEQSALFQTFFYFQNNSFTELFTIKRKKEHYVPNVMPHKRDHDQILQKVCCVGAIRCSVV